MTVDQIKAVSTKALIKDSLKLAKRIQKEKYEGTDWYVDLDQVKKVITFISMMRHTGGSLAGVPFRILPFQAEFIIEMICVLDKANHFRKHTEVILHIPRKSGKSELAAALNLYFIFMDKEPQKEIYSIASEVQQAAIIYHAAVSMISQSPSLLKRVKQYKAEKKLEVKNNNFIDLYRVLSAKAGTKDGLKTSVLFADEPHSYPDSALFDVVIEGSAHRDQPLAVLISTAGYNKNGFYHRKLNYGKQVMRGILSDEAVYAMVFEVDEDADWEDEKNWIKANPALGFGVKMKYLRDKFKKAQNSASDEVSFRTKHLNQWVNSAAAYIKAIDWEKSNQWEYNEEELLGQECYGGLDLSSTTDITSFTIVFPNDRGGYKVYQRNFIPEDTARERAKTDKVEYLQWAKDGHITLTKGNVIDYDELYYHIAKDLDRFRVTAIAYDRWNASAIVTKIMENHPNPEMVGFGQGFASMSSPVNAIESMALTRKLDHGNNPVLTWAISNCLVVTDAAENRKFDKSKAVERIDPAVSLAMAVGVAEAFREPEATIESLIV